jgi:hypothetical protein
MQAFIVRPFGIKQNINFEKVEEELIRPALNQLGVKGNTTAAILEQGNIREDMFSALLTADLVIADLSIHNANVFYELGIRHGLRDKRTFLIRSAKDEIPFDLKTDRYLSYQAENPAASLEALVNGLKATINSERQDSPVFYMLPKLEAQDPERFLAVPLDFGEEVEIAQASRQIGKLALLGSEAMGFPWELPALRVVGEEQFKLKAFEDARQTWEKIRNRYAADQEANDRLATIYQRLAEGEMISNPVLGWELLAQSDQAIKRLLTNYARLDKSKRAEVYALRARNAKMKWLDTWNQEPESSRRAKALQSTFLKEAFEDYERGCYEDLNHFYSGVNALGLLTVIISLAESLPEVWKVEYNTEDDAASALKKFKDQQQKLATVVQVSVDAEKKRLEREGKEDPWLNMTEADLSCLIFKKPQRVGNLYQKVIQDANDLNFEAAKRQLLIYQRLNVLPENVHAALAAFSQAKVFEEENKRHFLLFTGHMIDKPDRKEPRFPAEKELQAKAAIKEVVQQEIEKIDGPILGIAGGACGGDILFHEVCQELNIPTELYLALPREQFLVESVQFAGPQWIERFDRLYKKLPIRILSRTKELSNWLQKKPDYTIWERNNLWMLNNALVCGGMQMTLIALWNGEGGDAAGGTEHMVQVAQARGAKTISINTNKIFDLN